MPILGASASGAKSSPTAPTIGTATNVGTSRAYNNGSASVTFTAPTSKLPITSYTVTSSPGSYTGTGASSPITVAGLQSATAYTFTVTATSAAGTSPASSASNSITATTVPQAPTIGTATDGGTGTTATVTYTAGATGGAAVSTFTATSSPGSLTGTGASPITVSGLTTSTAYTFTVTATNANGTSAASAASNSVTPANPASFESIATATGNGSSDTITFSSIPGTYKHLQIRAITKGAGTSASYGYIRLQLNSDTGSNYSYHYMRGISSSVSRSGAASQTGITTSGNFFPDSYSPDNNNMVGSFLLDIHDYASTTKNKTIKYIGGCDYNTVGTSVVSIGSGLWINTASITSISITQAGAAGNWSTSAQFALYGIKG